MKKITPGNVENPENEPLGLVFSLRLISFHEIPMAAKLRQKNQNFESDCLKISDIIPIRHPPFFTFPPFPFHAIVSPYSPLLPLSILSLISPLFKSSFLRVFFYFLAPPLFLYFLHFVLVPPCFFFLCLFLDRILCLVQLLSLISTPYFCPLGCPLCIIPFGPLCYNYSNL